MELIKSEIPDEHDSKERMWVYKDNKEIFDKYSQIAMNQETTPIIVEQPKKQEKITKIGKINKKNTPLELIIQYTSSSENMKREIKEKLIELISLPEFSKAFGVKKSAEIISAITRDRWNQSTALFISFLRDSSIVYKEKPYIYN